MSKARIDFTRRDLALAAAGVALARCVPRSSKLATEVAFPLGVAAGDVTSDSVQLWTRYVGNDPLYVHVRRADGLGEVINFRVPIDGGIGQVDVSGLTASTRYTYSFSALDVDEVTAEGKPGEFTTAPEVDALPRLKFGAVSCTKFDHPMAVMSAAAKHTELQAFLMLGDTSYNDGARTEADFESCWARTIAVQQIQEFRSMHAQIATWDDHEVTNDWNGELVNDELKATAFKAWKRHVPSKLNTAGRVWRSLRFGKTAEIFVLDCRSERDPHGRLGADAIFISREQLDWLQNGLKHSDCVFKLVMTSVPIADVPGAGFTAFDFDRWQGYNSQRLKLLSFIDDNHISRVFFVSGDLHLAYAGRVATTGPGSSTLEFLVGPGAQAPNPATSYPSAPQFDFSSGINNFTEFDLNPGTGELLVTYRGPANEILFQKSYVP